MMSITPDEKSVQIRSKMASLRRHMHKDAKRIVANTTQLLDWKDYVRQFPKALVAVGLLTGFVLGPGRKVTPSVKLSQESIADLLSQRQQQLAAEAPKRSEFRSGAVRILTGLALSGVSTLARKSVENYLDSGTKSKVASTHKPFGSN
jgi:hypothetical protein